MCVPMSSPDSIVGSSMGERVAHPLKISECLYQDYLDIHMDLSALDSHENKI